MTYSNSSLAVFTKLSPHHSNGRVHSKYNPSGVIDKITIHHMAGNLSIETCANVFSGSREASSNYGVGSDGRVGLYVEEKDRAWTSSSPANDYRAVTIEVANDQIGGDWHVSDKALTTVISLCVDICKRNGIKKLNFTGDASGNLTMHCYFVATGCPGPYLKSKFQYIADQVNSKLSTSSSNGSSTSKEIVYTVVAGDTLSTIASKYATSYQKLAEYNGIANPDLITVGQKIKIPTSSSTTEKPWTPKKGDIVNFTGTKHYASANATTAKTCKPGKAKISLDPYQLGKSKHPYHLIAEKGSSSTVYGWVDAGTFTKA